MPTETLPIKRDVSAKCAMQHFGAWSVEPKWFRAAMDNVRNGTLKPMSAWDDDDDDEDDTSDYTIANGVALICMDGQMTKRGSSFGGCSTVATRQALKSAVADSAVKAIMLKISSPGGTVAGTAELAGAVAAANEIKTVYGHIDDLGCSAAYWVASQCDYLTANVTAMVGSIGTLMMLCDDTGAQEQIGIKWQVVSTGEYKGLGGDGQVTDKLVADVQREVNELNAVFLAGITAGRGKKIKDIPAVADGRVYVSAQALTLGLIDEIASFDAAMSAITNEVKSMTLAEFNAFAAANPEATKPFRDEGFKAGKAEGLIEGAKAEAGRFKALADKFGKDRPAFVAEQFAKGHGVAEAAVELADVQAAEINELKSQLAAKPAAAAPVVKDRPTQQPIPDAPSNESSEDGPEAQGRKAGEDAIAKMKKRRGIKD